MASVAVVHHNRELGLGRLERHLLAHDVVDVWAPDGDFPDDTEAVVVMGGFMGAYEVAAHPWLEGEKRWLAKRVGEEVPVLGICLGAQLLADSLGGRAFLAPKPEVGVVDVRLTGPGSVHPVVSHLGEKAFFAHQDTFDVPPEATLLAATDAYPAAFELGSALALQSHPETGPADALRWLDDPRFDLPARAGVTREEYSRGLQAHAEGTEAAARRVFDAWFGPLSP